MCNLQGRVLFWFPVYGGTMDGRLDDMVLWCSKLDYSRTNHSTELFFLQVKSDQFCKKLNLCQEVTALASDCHQTQGSWDKAETPHISQGMQSLNNYQEKVANSAYLSSAWRWCLSTRPLMLADMDKFLENKSLCVCPGQSSRKDLVLVPRVLRNLVTRGINIIHTEKGSGCGWQ